MSRSDQTTWNRPIPLIGDATAAVERAADPSAWAFPDAVRAAFYDVADARRDIRRFRPDPVPDPTLRRVLAAAHTAPSVGHSQPWRFVIVRDAAVRDAAALMAEREKLAQADLMDEESGRRLRDLSLEGIRAAPLGVVVCCDRRTPAAGVLGRATFPDADLWSCACAIQNLWLAARAEGLGLGWVTLFQPAELAALLGLPPGVTTLGWLCLGWPDERPPSPGLERRGWSRRLPLDTVTFTDRWPADSPDSPPNHLPEPDPTPGGGASTAPGPDTVAVSAPSDGALAAPGPDAKAVAGHVSAPGGGGFSAPGPEAVVAARDGADALLAVPGALGVLDTALDRVLAVRPAGFAGGCLVVAAADHPVTRHGVSAFPSSVTRQILDATRAGVSQGASAARAAGLDVIALDAGVWDAAPGEHEFDGIMAEAVRDTGARGDLVTEDALSGAAVRLLVEAGKAIGERVAGRGLVVLGEAGIGNTTPAAALAAGLLGLPAERTVGLGAGSDTAMVERKREVVARALARAGDRRDPLDLLAALGGGEFAVLTGVVLGAATRGAAVLLDGLATSVAALTAVRIVPGVAAHLVAGQRSRERGHPPVLRALGLEPLLDLRLRAGEGVGGAMAAALLLAALRTRTETARTTP
ncbi:5,6-dimethylbenzimidazole synthase [Actinocorallia sp. API 0066]|uniref:5,6-dimethylbenzimidazole synthase n=1 Tax=Actinocorallia sp. API 0066 TaxID=2896846 RepID=UPI001E297FF3|nr:5,6-dimethylbenzimidazole synthase [Actinocorallia sp. API 0066]MCD0449542.1 5,6-dimethylbenzimidazole synthase [Actinocorallia sp. API 0066]